MPVAILRAETTALSWSAEFGYRSLRYRRQNHAPGPSQSGDACRAPARRRRIDDGGEIADAEHSKVGDGESTAFEFLRLKLFRAGSLGERLHLIGDLGQALFFRTEQDGRDEPEIKRHGHTDVGMLVAEDRG